VGSGTNHLGDLLRFQKSMQSRKLPSFFLEKRTGVPADDCDDQMNPLLSISSKNSWKRPSSVPESGRCGYEDSGRSPGESHGKTHDEEACS